MSGPLWEFEALPGRDGRCFACGRPAGALMRRWTGHPEGAWTGWVQACARHSNAEAWTEVVETRFAVIARRRSRLASSPRVAQAKGRLYRAPARLFGPE